MWFYKSLIDIEVMRIYFSCHILIQYLTKAIFKIAKNDPQMVKSPFLLRKKVPSKSSVSPIFLKKSYARAILLHLNDMKQFQVR